MYVEHCLPKNLKLSKIWVASAQFLTYESGKSIFQYFEYEYSTKFELAAMHVYWDQRKSYSMKNNGSQKISLGCTFKVNVISESNSLYIVLKNLMAE
jgi:hypothetical protein